MDSKAMPPPPVPNLSPPLLESEIICLTSCLKNVVVKVGQVYSFYADTRRLGIQNQAFKPPQSVTAALGREIEKYDQLCDSIESQLLRAIAVLRRDLSRKERTIAAEASRLRDSMAPPVVVADNAIISLESHAEVSQQPLAPPKSTLSSVPLGRRPSAISISSLNRPTLPPKLDLSPSALRLAADDISMFSSGLASPVTLAPKSARAVGPDEFPADLMAAFVSASSQGPDRAVGINLTGIPENNELKSTNIKSMSSQPAAGDTSDKPIELDLDMDISNMSDLFGDASDNDMAPTLTASVEDLFSSDVAGGKSTKPETIPEKMNLGNTPSDLFSSLTSNSESLKKTDEMTVVDQRNLASGHMMTFSASSHTPEVASSKPDVSHPSTDDSSFDLYQFDANFIDDLMGGPGSSAEKGDDGESKPNA
ncbi:hypothetical protein BDQ17DRAFT_1341022 [Cyathus striatus]|nr:hypothetical protein BDQ17DRAFT_1341022 [Cyathus striatus]